jgi:NADPH:quinone reductase-like Zn-dependent oxidoreductase
MRCLSVQGSFGLEHLLPEERPEPSPGPGQVVVRVRAASLNYRDLLMIKGLYNPKQPLPLVPCSDGAGEVVKVGAGVTRVKVGDRVATTFAQGWHAGEPTRDKLKTTLGGPLDGTLQESMLLSEQGVVRVPDHLSFVEAATLPCAALTAWTALTQADLRAGDVLLVQGTGGVAMFGLQLGRLLGAQVIVTSSSDEKLEQARRHGAWQTINYRSVPAWGAKARELTGGRGVDHVLELGGGATLAQSLAAVRPGGVISVIGILGGTSVELSLLPILMSAVRLQGVLVGHREGFEAMNRAIAAHRLVPIVDGVVPWLEARAALERMEAGAHLGKLCLELAGG